MYIEKFQNLIIGSGPTGVSAAYEIIKTGKKATILDIGTTISDKNLIPKIKYLADQERNSFVKNITKNKKKKSSLYKNPNLKFPFGSDYVFKRNKFEKFIIPKNIDILTSNARGGLSNIWGTMVSPFYKKDIKHWDINYKEFYSELSNVLKYIPISSQNDNLKKFFKIDFGSKHKFKLSSSGQDFLNSLNDNKNLLNSKGIFFGRSKLAISNLYAYQNVDCKECGLCHFGCPYDCMYNSDFLLQKLKNDNKLFKYKNNFFVKNIKLDEGNWIVNAHDLIEKKNVFFLSKNLFLAAGPISTAAIILRSNLLKQNEVIFKESQRFFIPIFSKKLSNNALSQNKNTLSEIFIEIYNEDICNKSIHLQYYSFLDIMLETLEKFFGKFAYALPKIFPFIFGRLNLFVGYLHSDFSSKIVMSKKGNMTYSFKIIKAKNSNSIIDKLIEFINQNFKKNFLIFNFLKNINLVGASYHYGSSFPMTKEIDKEATTSLFGELNGYKNLYILDSSILPDIPASPTTFNVCLNVSRIIKDLSNKKKL